MKRLFVILSLFCFFVSPAIADDLDLSATGDLWDNWNSSQETFGQDKSVSDEDFDKAIEQIKDKKNRNFFGMKKRDKNIPKGEEFSQSNETEILNKNPDIEELPVVSLPVEIETDKGIIPIGHYQIKAEKKDDNLVLKLFQAHYVIAEFPATETNDDFGEDTISFAKWTVEAEDKIKIMFGSLDYNAYSVIKIKNSKNNN